MIRRLVHHANHHSIAYLALACSMLALAGASYASFNIPDGSVGEKQLKNQSIDPVKWDPIYVTAFVRRWAHVDATGRILNAGASAQAKAIGGPGSYDVTWGDAFNGNCMPIATVETGQNHSAGFANAHVIVQPNNATVVNVLTYDTHGNPTPEPFYLGVVCPRGAGGGTIYPYTIP